MDVKVTDNSEAVLSALAEQIVKALKMIGAIAEGYAKEVCPVATGRLRNSIANEVDEDTAYIGTNVEYAPYIEYGTGIYAENGDGRQTPWAFQDEKGEWHITRGSRPYHYLKSAVTEHNDEYESIVKAVLQG